MSLDEGECRGVSATIGLVLMVAIVVVLAAFLGVVMTGFESELVEPKHPVSFETEWVADGADNGGSGAYVVLTLTGGNAISQDRVIVVDEYGNEVTWSEVWTTPNKDVVDPGDYVHLDGHLSDGELRPICAAGDSYRIVIRQPDGDTTVVDKFVAPSEPTVKHSDCP